MLGQMQALKVQVKNGRLVVDEPTDLPDGAEVEVVVIDDELTAVDLHARDGRRVQSVEAPVRHRYSADCGNRRDLLKKLGEAHAGD
jgi:hypothetical protein